MVSQSPEVNQAAPSPIARFSQGATPAEKRAFLRALRDKPGAAAALRRKWRLWARPQQLAPTERDWTIWLILAGRGWGKTRTASEWVREEVAAGRRGRWAFVSQDPADARDVMIEGPSGILAVSRPDERPKYEPSKKRLTWPNGAIANIYSAEDPESLRGPEHDGAWGDEFCAWHYINETLDNLRFGLRITGPKGHDPRVVFSTTPKPVMALRNLRNDPDTYVTKGSTYDNERNLAAAFRKAILSKYEGTAKGRQEIWADEINEVVGALWTREILEEHRVEYRADLDLQKVVIAVDPMVKKNAKRRQSEPETGIVAFGRSPGGQGYVLGDHSVGKASPDTWARRAIAAVEMHKADYIVAETNNGGDMVEDVIKTRAPHIKVKQVTASRGKWTRAEPIAGLYEQGRISHVGYFAELETQLCTWSGEDGESSPDRLDALVWGASDTMLGPVVPDIVINPQIGQGIHHSRWDR